MRREFLWLGLAALLAGPGGPARADVSARAVLSGFGYTLIDLNPGDGIAPALGIDPMHFSAGQQVYAAEGSLADDDLFYRGLSGVDTSWTHPFELFPTAQREVGTDHAAAAARMGGDVAGHGFGAVAEGWARNVADDPHFASVFGASVTPANGQPGLVLSHALTLTPFTQVVWSGQLTLEAEATQGYRRGRPEIVTAWADMLVSDDEADQAEHFFQSVSTQAYRRGRFSESFDIRLSLVNDGAAPLNGYFTSRMEVRGVSFLPVPEPGTPALMLCGLGVVAGLARRRRRAAA